MGLRIPTLGPVHSPVATVVQVPSGFCTLVIDCLGFAPEGHTSLPDSKEGVSLGRMGTGLYTLTLVGATALMLGIVGIEFLVHRQYLQAAFQAERQHELIEEP